MLRAPNSTPSKSKKKHSFNRSIGVGESVVNESSMCLVIRLLHFNFSQYFAIRLSVEVSV